MKIAESFFLVQRKEWGQMRYENVTILFVCVLLKSYLQSTSARLEEWRIKRRDTEEWMRRRQLPVHLQERVRRFVQYKWIATRGVDEESILRNLPLDLRRQIQRHLSLALVRRVSPLAKYLSYYSVSVRTLTVTDSSIFSFSLKFQ